MAVTDARRPCLLQTALNSWQSSWKRKKHNFCMHTTLHHATLTCFHTTLSTIYRRLEIRLTALFILGPKPFLFFVMSECSCLSQVWIPLAPQHLLPANHFCHVAKSSLQRKILNAALLVFAWVSHNCSLYTLSWCTHRHTTFLHVPLGVEVFMLKDSWLTG